jgi:hypothetical protein
MELQDYTKMTALTEEWKQAVSEQVDALWAATGTTDMEEWAYEFRANFIHLMFVSEYHQALKGSEVHEYPDNFEEDGQEWLKAVKVLKRGQEFLFD